ncbi:MAG: YicC family protein [Bacteroidetes bacterium]|nr:YicC family protein [Bacteroidota bacterium]
MLKSMTGYGKSVCELENKKVTIEIKSLNSKQLDVSVRMPSYYKEKEIFLRNEISKQLSRGKIDASIFVESINTTNTPVINQAVVKNYYEQLQNISNDLNLSDENDILSVVMGLPDTLKVEKQKLNQEEWNTVFEEIKHAIMECDEFRIQEGDALEKDIIKRIYNINNLLSEVDVFEHQRIDKIKKRISDNLHEFVETEKIDNNRFEQEVIYYLEKIDITEEKVRLKNHCNYFLETANSEDPIGKKLGFITQEIGREINTLGSKANNLDIQKLVIQMKDELEKIKEQVLNVL